MKKQTGFTLVELIIVIVILGILAVTAAPKFLDLQGDANASTIQGVAGAADSASSIVYGKSVIAGLQKQATGTITADTGESIGLVYGYPDVDLTGSAASGIVVAMDVNVADLNNSGTANSADFNFNVVSGAGVFYANGSTEPTAVTDAGCFVWYAPATRTGTTPNFVYNAATTTVQTNDC